jgi:integrase
MDNFLNYNNFLNRIWNRAMEKTGLRRRTPHDMRHTYATLRLSKGDSLAEVSKEMGHSSSDITYKTYYTWLPRESRTNIDELDDFHVVTKILSDTDLRTRSTSQTVIGAEVDHQ